MLETAFDGFGYPAGGSRGVQWGWAPVGGASQFDRVLTPNYLIALGAVGTVTVSVNIGVILCDLNQALMVLSPKARLKVKI